MNPTNESLMAAYGSTGDQSAFATLVKRCEGMVYSYALRTLGSRDEAEEVPQEVFLRVHASRARYRQDRPFVSWLMAITVNVCRDRLRRARTRRNLGGASLDDVPEPSEHHGTSDPLELVENRETRRAVEEAVYELPLGYREALVLHYTQSLSIAQMAEVLGISRSAVETRLYRARLLMRAALRNGKDPR